LPYQLDFQPVGRKGSFHSDVTLLEAARTLGVDLVSLCGGQGSCKHCKVRLLEGTLSPLTAAERERLTPQELQLGYRLACQAVARSDVKLYVPPESLSAPQRTQLEGQELSIAPDPIVQAFEVHLSPPTLQDLTADEQRLAQALEQQHGVRLTSFDIETLRDLSPRLRSLSWRAQVSVREAECIAVDPAGSSLVGLAIDLGTTKVAGYLVDLSSGRTMTSKGAMNPQIAYGEDVITRCSRALQAGREAQAIQELATQALRRLAEELCAEVNTRPDSVLDAVVVGNTAMHHLLLRLPVQQLVQAPYVPAVSRALDIKARDLELGLAPGAYVHLLPNIAGYVGSDHVAVILSTELWRAEGVVLALDIGTNTEICLSNNGQMTSVSCASGPAFEGAHIQHGMRAAPGAIEHLRLAEDGIEWQTVAGGVPVGLCGSGTLDALAQLYEHGVLDRSGKMGEHPRVRDRDGQREFVLIGEEERVGGPAITITQHDVRELQLAKGAIRTGIEALLQACRLTPEDIDEVIIAGAFGNYIDVASAVAIGMFPSLPANRFRQVGNAAGTGARLALVSREQRALAAEIAQHVAYIELAGVSNFQDLFARSLYLGESSVLEPH